MASPIIGLRLPEDVLARLDARRGDLARSAYVRRLIEADLVGVSAPQAVKSKVPGAVKPAQKPEVVSKEKLPDFGAIPERWAADAELLYRVILPAPISAKKARDALGWFEGRYDRVEAALVEADRVMRVSGLLVAR